MKPQTPERFYALLPDYISGVVWLVDIIALCMIYIPFGQARRAAERFALLVDPITIPELAVGFILAVFGVLLPLAIALALNPLSLELANAVARKWYWKRPLELLTSQQEMILDQRFKTAFGVEPPRSDMQRMILYYMEVTQREALSSRLWLQKESITLRLKLSFPVALMLGLATFLMIDTGWLATTAAFAVAALAYTYSIHASVTAHLLWDEGVLMAFIVATSLSGVPQERAEQSGFESLSSDQPR